jgi:membrane peptidoglycan carboxypeptidase
MRTSAALGVRHGRHPRRARPAAARRLDHHQQVVKNVFLWHGRSWPRKALEAGMTPLVEAAGAKRRILEVYLNIAEFDAGVFGVQAAAQHYFDRDAAI